MRCFFLAFITVFLVSLLGCFESFKADSLSDNIKDLKTSLFYNENLKTINRLILFITFKLFNPSFSIGGIFKLPECF